MSGEKTCPRCGKAFVCGMESGAQRCWCADLPPLPKPQEHVGCYCPECLKALLAQAAQAQQ